MAEGGWYEYYFFYKLYCHDGFSQTIISNSINDIQPINEGSAEIQIVGINKVGETLTVNIVVDDPDGNGNLLTNASYQWKY